MLISWACVNCHEVMEYVAPLPLRRLEATETHLDFMSVPLQYEFGDPLCMTPHLGVSVLARDCKLSTTPRLMEM